MMSMSTIERFRDEINPGERIIWSGQPQQGFMLRLYDAIAIPFSLVWGGFVIGWATSFMTSDVPFLFIIFVIPFILVGLYMILGRFFVDIMTRRRTFYALTNQRVIIISGLFSQNTKSLELSKLPEINISTRSNGKGTITFGPLNPMSWINTGSNFPSRSRYPISPNFEMIDDARMVYQHIKNIQREGS